MRNARLRTDYTEADALSSRLVDEARARRYAQPAVFYLRFDEVNYDQPLFVFDWSHELRCMAYIGHVMTGNRGCPVRSKIQSSPFGMGRRECWRFFSPREGSVNP